VIKEKKKEELTSVPTKKETISLQSPKSASYLDGGIEQKFTFDSKIHQSLVEIEAKTPKEFNNGLNKYIGKPFLTI